MNIRPAWCLPLIFAAALLMHACSSDKATPEPRAVPVVTVTAEKKTVPVSLRALGSVESFETVLVKSQVTAEIRKVHFIEGQDVNKGDLLFELDSEVFEAEFRKAGADLARDRAQARFARIQSERYAGLVKKDYVAREQFEQIEANAKALEAAVKADEAALEKSRIEVERCTIRSPMDGRTGMLRVHAGNIARANETELLTINRIVPVKVSFAVPEKDLPALRKHFLPGSATHGSPGKIGVEALVPGEEDPEKGELSFMDNAVNPSTGTITLKALFPNPKKRLVPGQFVDVVLTLATEPDTVVVPSRCVEQGRDGQYVFVIGKDLAAQMRPVVTGREIDDMTVIIKGISPGEQVVIDGQVRLTPGAGVTLKAMQ